VNQVIILVGEHRLEHSGQQFVGHRDNSLYECVSQNGIPNSEVVRVNVLHKPSLIEALIVVVDFVFDGFGFGFGFG